MKTLLVDAHQDLAWNILTFGRDYTLSVMDTRQREQNSLVPTHNGDTLLGWPEFQTGRVAVILATLFATPTRASFGVWDTQTYADPDQANSRYSSQLDAYRYLVDEHPDKFQLVLNRPNLEAVLTLWQQDGVEAAPVGLVPLMEGADAVRYPSELETWWQRGLRIIGPAWGGNRFCGGTHEPGPLTKQGYALLEGMASCGYSLDLSHMDELAVLQALDFYPGRIIATHANAKALLRGTQSNRFLSNRVIQGLILRGGVIGVVPFNPFLIHGWKPSDGRQAAGLQHLVAHIDHICQIAGNAHHVGIGSDFDGGFGLQQTPSEIDTIADLQKLIPLLAEKGYTDAQIAAVMGQNWIQFLLETLPQG
jgi:membrane dipeptidase